MIHLYNTTISDYTYKIVTIGMLDEDGVRLGGVDRVLLIVHKKSDDSPTTKNVEDVLKEIKNEIGGRLPSEIAYRDPKGVWIHVIVAWGAFSGFMQCFVQEQYASIYNAASTAE